MAEVAEPGVCEACGRPLPVQHGKGRKRRYCDARCRDVARRARGRSSRGGERAVKDHLTTTRRHEYVDSVDGASGAVDPVTARIGEAARRLIEESRGNGSALDAVSAARDLAAAAETALQAAVDRARATGQSWREIGEVLGTSRQAAFQRFGHPVDPSTGEPMSREVPPSAIERAAGFLARFAGARWEEVLEDFDDFMRERHDVNRLASGWAQLIGMFGSYQRMGEISPVLAGDSIVVDVRLDFEAGEAMAWVRFDRDGKVSGLRLHPPSAIPR
jgi:Protein of unknown function (DUF3887)